jgi:hypothetical protein
MKHESRTIGLSLGALALTIAVIANLEGTLQFMARITPVFFIKIPLGVVLLVVVLLVAALFVVYRRHRNFPASERISVSNEGQFFERTLQLFFGAQERVIVSGLAKDWVFHLVVAVYIARRKQIRFDIICADGHHERYRLLELLGCRVHRVEAVNVEGVLADPAEIRHARALLRCPRPSENIAGRYYHSSPDWFAINSSFQSALTSMVIAPDTEGEEFAPQLQAVPHETLIGALTRVPFYRDARVTIEEVSLNDTFPSSRFIARYKLIQVAKLVEVFEQERWPLFRPCGIALANAKTSLVIPPVLEEHDGKLYVAEGHTRLYFLRTRLQHSKVVAAVVRGVTKPLPLEPTHWRNVTEVDLKDEHRNAELARYIESSTHQGVWSA